MLYRLVLIPASDMILRFFTLCLIVILDFMIQYKILIHIYIYSEWFHFAICYTFKKLQSRLCSTLRVIPVRDDDSGPNGKLLSYRQ